MCIFLGAGAALASGGPSFNELKRACLEEFLGPGEADLHPPEHLDDIFEQKIEAMPMEVRAAAVSFLIEKQAGLTPSDGYKILVLLAQEGLVDAIVTTNFDNILESAESDLNTRIFQTYAAGIASPYEVEDGVKLPRSPVYLKLHGDLDGGVITHILVSELRREQYRAPFKNLLEHLVTHNILIFVGYSGQDELLANLFASWSRQIRKPVYWCSPEAPHPGAALVGALSPPESMVWIQTTSEEVLCEIGASCLTGALYLHTAVPFVESLLAARIGTVCAGYLKNHRSSGAVVSREQLLVRRVGITRELNAFAESSEANLAVVTGKSGAGKSTTMIQLYDRMEKYDFPEVLPLSARSFTSYGFVRHLSALLGYSPDHGFTTLYQLATWLARRGRRLLVVVDGLNEYSPNPENCKELFKEVVFAAHWVQHQRSLKIIVTLQPALWNEIATTLDTFDLRSVLWRQSLFDDRLRAIYLDEFDWEELEEAYERYAQAYGVATPYRVLSDSTKRLLANPDILRSVLEARSSLGGGVLAYDVYRDYFERKVSAALGADVARGIHYSLACLAKIAADKARNLFDRRDLQDSKLDLGLVGRLIDLGILVEVRLDEYFFAHDSLAQYFLAAAIARYSLYSLTNAGELGDLLLESETYPLLRGALAEVMVHGSSPSNRNLETILLQAGSSHENAGTPNATNLARFAKDCFIQMATNRPDEFGRLAKLGLIIESPNRHSLLRTIASCASASAPRDGLMVLKPLISNSDDVLRREAHVFSLDHARRLLLFAVAGSGAMEEQTLDDFLEVEGENPLTSLLRLSGILADIGADNTSPAEWTAVLKWGMEHLKLLSERQFPRNSGAILASMATENANRIFFNAAPDIVDQFFMSEDRRELRDLANEVFMGHGLTDASLRKISSFVSRLGRTWEFIICNLIIACNMKRDLSGTLSLLEGYFASFDNSTPAEEIDFFLSALYLGMSVSGENPHTRITTYTEQILLRLPQAALENPGAERARTKHRFSDPFDLQFEDGFNPLAFYFYAAPVSKRQSLSYQDYIRHPPSGADLVPLYWEALASFESENRIEGILRIVHALGQMISIWPTEGLRALEELVGRSEPTVRRGLVRVLSEAYARFPDETITMIRRSGGALSAAEVDSVRYMGDRRLLERTLEQVHWARILRFYHLAVRQTDFLDFLLEVLVESFSLPEALGKIIDTVIDRPTAEIS